ncbi:hypothetical protein B0J15DRAFT_106653 [Fusarium solani]|uniref:Uncharacterized protein n=1 Tax=Fusarium solani TaxID=169388 RepID=A0A9P9RD38_FUSSL|nr:uncharacterized protein B0J15DRAFT_106653 [Fusarium solani]KAH7273655.1 hypothetical protein B0J15DRAFT_106653 [Fusarium solani]
MLKPLSRNEETHSSNPLVLLLIESQIRPKPIRQVRDHSANKQMLDAVLNGSGCSLKCLVDPLYICISSPPFNGAAVEAPSKNEKTTITRDKKVSPVSKRQAIPPTTEPSAGPDLSEITTPDSRGTKRHFETRRRGIPATDIRPPAGHSGRGKKAFGCSVSHRQIVERLGPSIHPPLAVEAPLSVTPTSSDLPLSGRSLHCPRASPESLGPP